MLLYRCDSQIQNFQEQHFIKCYKTGTVSFYLSIFMCNINVKSVIGFLLCVQRYFILLLKAIILTNLTYYIKPQGNRQTRKSVNVTTFNVFIVSHR